MKETTPQNFAALPRRKPPICVGMIDDPAFPITFLCTVHTRSSLSKFRAIQARLQASTQEL